MDRLFGAQQRHTTKYKSALLDVILTFFPALPVTHYYCAVYLVLYVMLVMLKCLAVTVLRRADGAAALVDHSAGDGTIIVIIVYRKTLTIIARISIYCEIVLCHTLLG